MICIIAGSSSALQATVYSAMEQCPFSDAITIVVSGKQKKWDTTNNIWRGADYWGERWAEERLIPVLPFPAEWGKWGRSAGPIRNNAMAEVAQALVLVWDGLSPGSSSMLRIAQSRGWKEPDTLFVYRFISSEIVRL